MSLVFLGVKEEAVGLDFGGSAGMGGEDEEGGGA